MKNRFIAPHVVIIWLILHSGMAIGQARSHIDELIANYVDIQHKRIGFSGSVLVATDDEILSWHSVGTASHELNLPISRDSKFKIASVTKAFIGLLMVLAEKEGKLRYQDKLEAYFPQLENEKWKHITLLQLLSHTSGIPRWNGINDYWTVKSKLSLNQEQALKEIFNMQLVFEPGVQSQYSSPAYYLLAAILEKVYKKTYADLLHEKILSPLKFSNTGVYNQLRILPDLASGYHLISDDSLVAAPYRDFFTNDGWRKYVFYSLRSIKMVP